MSLLSLRPSHLRLADEVLSLRFLRRCPTSEANPALSALWYDMYVEKERGPVGQIDLRLGYSHSIMHYEGNLGYYVQKRHRGRRLAYRACCLLRQVALDHGMTTLWITCSPENEPSRRTCEALGAVFLETVEVPEDHYLFRRGETVKLRYRWDLSPE